MALKNLFDMVKADRYTADGREALIKAQEAETEDATRRTYQIGEISQSTGLQKTANGWVKPKNGKQPGAASKHDTDPQTYIVKKNDELRKMYLNEKDPAKKEAMKKALKKQASMMEPEPFSSTESKPAENKSNAMPKVNGPDMAVRNFESKGEKVTNWNGTKNGFLISTTKGDYQYVEKADGSFELMDRPKVTQGEALQQSIKSHGEKAGSKPAVESIGRDDKLNKVRQVLNTALTPSGDKVQMTKSKVTGDFHVLLNGKSTGGGFRDPQKAKEEFNAWIAGKKAPSESAKERINKRFDESEARSQKAMESKPDAADQRDQIGGEIKGNLEAAKYYFDKAQSFYPTDPSYKTYMTKAKQYNDEAKAQADDNGFDFEEMHNSGVTQAVNKYAEEQSKPAASKEPKLKEGVMNSRKAKAFKPELEEIRKTDPSRFRENLMDILSSWTDENEGYLKNSSLTNLMNLYNYERNQMYETGDAAPRVLTGDCRIRIRKEKPALTGDTKIRVRK